MKISFAKSINGKSLPLRLGVSAVKIFPGVSAVKIF
jgi:hypothetical protein